MNAHIWQVFSGIVGVLLCVMPVVGREPVRTAESQKLRRDHTVYPVSATAGFETGIVTLASIAGTLRSKNLMPARPLVDWGDGTEPAPALFANCSARSDLTNCDVLGTHVYEEVGAYDILISFSLLFGGAQTLTTTASVTEATGLVIVSIGDSVASGEGNPVHPTTDEPAQWDDVPSNTPPYEVEGKQCHRSSLAGPALAAAKVMEGEDATFMHLACSGDTVSRLIDQLWHARSRLSHIDVLLMSGGANDIAGGFGSVITSCIDPRPKQSCSDDPDFAQELSSSFAELPDKYADLDLAIQCLKKDTGGALVADDRCSGPEQVPSLVVITEYFDPTRGRNGEFPGHLVSTSCVGHAIAPKEWSFLYDHMVVPLNEAVAAAAVEHGWVLVTGIADAFREHGYCAAAGPSGGLGDNWVVKIPESISNQSDLDDVWFPICFVQEEGCDGDLTGTGHPNLSGQEVYRDGIFDAVVEFNPPQTTATATSGGAAYHFGTSAMHAVTVTLSPTNLVRKASVGTTYYAVDDPDCTATPVNMAQCSAYTGPFTIDRPGRHTVTYFSENRSGRGLERAKTL